eukprot:2282066-Pyramimonas_sp.AAC.1
MVVPMVVPRLSHGCPVVCRVGSFQIKPHPPTSLSSAGWSDGHRHIRYSWDPWGEGTELTQQ